MRYITITRLVLLTGSVKVATCLTQPVPVAHDSTRRTIWVAAASWASGLAAAPVHALETIGKDPSCNTASCLGVWDGLLADCPPSAGGGLWRRGGAGCVASQDDTPGVFAEPWDYSESSEYGSSMTNAQIQRLMDRILQAIRVVAERRGDEVRVQVQDGRYLRVLVVDASQEESVGEFYLTPNDTTVQFRVASLSNRSSRLTLLRNKDRMELVRTELRFDKIPVLRNRSRSFWFVESDDWDTFGPSSNARLLLLDPLDAETRTLNSPGP